jgi:hypothetical protein
MIQRFPPYGFLAILLLAGGWIVNWSFEGLRTHWGFFVQWLGYILLLDALIYSKKGSSILTRSRPGFITLFLLSVPFWWLFELLNERVQYWSYNAREQFTDLEYFLYASLNFSTVIPAIFETYELLSLSKFFQKELKGPKVEESGKTFLVMLLLGIVMLILVLLFPQPLPYFLWISLYFIFEPVNFFLGFPTLLSHTEKRNWTPIYQLFLAGLICGFFWELWNYYAHPRWEYHLTGFEYLYVFEMPAAGYLGYLPFALELWAYYHLMKGLLKLKYLQ